MQRNPFSKHLLDAHPTAYYRQPLLTPSHLIYGGAINIMPQKEVTKSENSCEERFKYVSLKLEHFWKRWQKEYLANRVEGVP